MRRFIVVPLLGAALVLLPALPALSASPPTAPSAATGIDSPVNGPRMKDFELVGHNALLNRGMNSAIAIRGDYAYIGSRTGGSHPNAGVLVLDISDPADPTIVNQIGPPHEGNPGQTSRELRVWPDENLLMVLNFQCSPLIHACVPADVEPTIKFYDIAGENAADPQFVHTYRPSREPHEFYLWDDPNQQGRALVYMSTPSGSTDNILVADVSSVRQGEVTEVASAINIPGEALHSLSLNVAGTRAYLAYLEKGFLVADTSELAEGTPDPQIELLTPPDQSADWAGPGAHSAVKLFGSPHALVTDEVYGEFGGLLPDHGCPWGWTRLIDIGDPAAPQVVSEYKLRPVNYDRYCDRVSERRNNFSSFASHNPTLTRNLAFITWHSGGLQAVSIERPHKPKRTGQFLPEPLPHVVTEDPALSSGPDKIVMWSYPIISDGLIYVVDIRNGLYVMKYEGKFADEVAEIDFLEGNSNLGDARRLAG